MGTVVEREAPAAPAPTTSEPIIGELYGSDRLARHARQLARRQRTAPREPSRRWWSRGKGALLLRLDDTERVLREIHGELSRVSAAGMPVSPAADWLLDNFHVVIAQIAEVRATLPGDYYAELPKLAQASGYAGYPRVYEIAVELIMHTDGRLDPETLELMVRQYQQVTPLSMGELWALPAMLRMAFLENVGRMARRASSDSADTVAADAWVTRLLAADDAGPTVLARALADFVDQSRLLTPAFLTRFLQQMRSRRADFTPLLWLEQWIGEDVMSVEEAVQRSTQRLALTQLVMANSIASLRAIGNIDWRDFVEDTSLADAILRTDPSGVYRGMTFGTRDHYRHVVERLAKRTEADELDVARAAIAAAMAAAARSGPTALEAHVGYHLIDAGYPALAASVGYRAPAAERLRTAARGHPSITYLVAIALLASAAVGVLLQPLGHASGWRAVLALLLVLGPSADIAVSLVNQLVHLLLGPARLPRLDFSTAVPPASRTVVVVPILLGSVSAVEEALEHLEAQYLANDDPEIRFALLGDLLDNDQPRVDGDAAIVAAAVERVRALNAAYLAQSPGRSPFYVFLRARRLNAADAVWMGWERKRGKLADFNAWLLGAAGDAFATTEGDLTWLPSARYVITLDSDTVLPRDAGRTLIGTIAHPLNRAEFDAAAGRVTRGYGILQPRVSVSLASANSSRYAGIFAGHPGVDPYTTAVSDVYQDLFAEGTYTGKGIYDVAVFERATAGRFPENSLLSHDLIEGAFARAALVTDVEVFDDYPARYLTSTRRLHRWIRGDWQLLPWLLPSIPGPRGASVNPLATVSRWKMLDNMRRSLTPVLTLAWLVAGWTLLPHAGLRWMLTTFAAFGFPWYAPLVVAALRPPRSGSWRPYYAGLSHDLASSAKQFAVAIVMLPHQALLAADAIVRTLYRLRISHRHLLEWQTSSQEERASLLGRAPVWRRMGSAVALAAALLAAMWWHVATAGGAPAGWGLLAALSLGWMLSPEIAYALSAPRTRADLALTEAQRATLLEYARDHWHYFEQFATAETHWLVPDNVQETPAPVVAARTSPTNVGLQLLSTMSAHDLGFLTLPEMLDRMERVLETCDRLPKVRGHLMNWYDLADLRVLDPPYVSAVDSGNLAGHLMAVSAACDELTDGAPPALASRLQAAGVRARAMAMAMDFTLFYDTRRRLLSIGYDVRSGRLDESTYDLLASEARLASFVAVAKGDVPVEHWFHLGRTLTTAGDATALVSWSGSMFEYLMPVLVMASRPYSLLDQTHQAAVRRQIAYAASREVPWGMSESAYNLRDRHETYQYRAFGVPDLALKRGLAADVVVAPYASALALAVDPHAALANLAGLVALGARGTYGFYDALDYTRPAPEAPFALVRNFMAHHVGMSLVAFDNALHTDEGSGIWQRRFMRDKAVRASALLLDERVPRHYTALPAQSDAPEVLARTRPARAGAVVRELSDVDTTEPQVGLLGGLAYCVLLTEAGGGYSRAGGTDVFRWRADATRDETGQWLYVRDAESGQLWSATHQPVRARASSYRVTFAADRVVYTRMDAQIETRTEIVVVPRERAEIRRVTVCNRSRVAREIELTSYGEIVLTDAGADRAHSAFQNLFVETEWLPELGALLASRRPRAATEQRPWLAHVVACGPEKVGDVTCETDRARFVGRGRSVHAPAALDAGATLSGTAGAVLDPIAALRVRVSLEPGRSATVAFTTVVADSREQALQATDRYRDIAAARRALALSGTEAQIELRDLDISPADAALYQDLAGALIYPRDSLRAPRAERMTNRRGQTALWALGISGDLPIVLATIRDATGVPSVRQLLAAHKYWRMKGVRCDLVILNTKGASYIQDLHDQLTTLVLASSEGGTLESPGGVYVRRADVLAPEDAAMLRTTAAIHVICDGVGLGEIVEGPESRPRAPAPSGPPTAQVAAAPVIPAAAGNGYGAMNDALDYVIGVDAAHVPPAPWANVIANPNVGFCVTERGGGFAWVENSYFFRLTPWFNDPVADPAGEVLYLQDAESGAAWTPTPGPSPAVAAPAPAPYEVTHAPGRTVFTHTRHDIRSELALGVPLEDPVKITRLRLTNTGSAPRTIVVTSFVEWVLGSERERTRHQLHTRRDESTGALLAQNFFQEEWASQVAFSWISEPVTSATASRVAFIGRNGDLARPAGSSVARLDDEVDGAGEDPCAALRCSIALQPGESREVVVLLGAARSDDEVRAIIGRCGAPGAAAAVTRAAVTAWDHRLSTIRVQTPSPELDALVNRWSLYQALACRMWARSALYQSSGAFGFRDQLQDGMAFVYADPQVARAHILRSASRQFVEGDVQHWWHEPSGRGVRTRFSDDLVWLPFCADHYVRVTGDTGIWDESVAYLEMRALEPHEHEVYDLPRRSERAEPLYAHALLALKKASTSGPHELPLIGSGDWNDGMNRVGIEGKGESVWLAWFLIATLRRFAVHATTRGDADAAAWCRTRADAYAAAVERSAWDGAWYRRAWYDDGTPLGSAQESECQIDAIAQSWSIISGAGDPERARTAMRSVGERLVKDDERLILLLTPPFDVGGHDPGYIQGYVPGVRENGAQYTHAALWTVLATVGLGDGDRAFHLLDLLNPLTHARTPEEAERYKVEPYVVAADVYTAEGHVGRGGWTWYTGSASWSYRVALEGLLGFHKQGDTLRIAPCIPAAWDELRIDYRFGSSSYAITVRNPDGATTGVRTVEVDGITSADGHIALRDDGGSHVVTVTMGAAAPSPRGLAEAPAGD